jgi:hypothetical protein
MHANDARKEREPRTAKIPHWSIRRWMVCWTPLTLGDGYATRGAGRLVLWDDWDRANSYDRNWTHSAGACDMIVHKFDTLERQHWVLSTAMGLVISGELRYEVMHALFWPILEYRMALPSDIAAPPGDKRFGAYAMFTHEGHRGINEAA